MLKIQNQYGQGHWRRGQLATEILLNKNKEKRHYIQWWRVPTCYIKEEPSIFNTVCSIEHAGKREKSIDN